MSQTALKRTCMRDQIREVLVARILDGTYPAGTQLKELTLAREFNVSQAPIREALRELEGSGLVTSERFRGTRVRGADFDEMRESYELRIMLEVRSVELAAPYARELLDELDHLVRVMESALKVDDQERYIDHALRFHRRLVESSRNRTFLRLWDSLLWDIRGRIALRRLIETGRSLKPVIALHRALVARLRAQDVAGSGERVSEILERVKAVFASK
ncbi:MAG TPA: GntR family transcriptional regulator [Steroidobacteraceae bacterium]|nr:GntR family transcriptional regulator [Steroidobacteraceae bacterium]